MFNMTDGDRFKSKNGPNYYNRNSTKQYSEVR